MREQTARSFTADGEWLRPSMRSGVHASEVFRLANEAASAAPVIRESHLVAGIHAAAPGALAQLGIDPTKFREKVMEFEADGSAGDPTTRLAADPGDAPSALRDEIWKAAGHAFMGSRWDDAIFDAMRIVASTLQVRLSSNKIGGHLVEEAFLPAASPRVRISSNPIDNERLADLFRGALGYLKGARSHGEIPPVPCPSREMCERVLAFASFLLDQLDLDQAVAPEIVALRPDGPEVFEVVTLRADDASVLVDGRPANVLSRVGAVWRVGLESAGPHAITLVAGPRRSATVALEAEPHMEDANFHLVEAVKLQIFQDARAVSRRPENAVRIRSYEGGRRFTRYFPAGRDDFVAGEYVDWTWESPVVVGESWVRDEGELRYAWTSSMGFTGRHIASTNTARLIRIALRPSPIRIRPGEVTPLRVIAYYRDGPACWREDVTRKARIESTDSRVAYVDDRRATVRAKATGDARIRARLEQFFDEAEVRVAALSRGTVTEFLGGIRRIVRLACGPDGLWVSNQSDSLLRVGVDGALEYVARLEVPPTAATGTEHIAVDPEGNVYVREVWTSAVVRIDASSGYTHSELVARAPDQKALIALVWSKNLGGLVIGDSDGQLSVWRNGKLEPWVTIGSFVVDMAATDDALLAITARSGPAYTRVEWKGTASVLPLPLGQTQPSAIGVRNGQILVADFNGGRVLLCGDNRSEVIAQGLSNPSGLAIGQDGSIYVANFGGDSVSRILP